MPVHKVGRITVSLLVAGLVGTAGALVPTAPVAAAAIAPGATNDGEIRCEINGGYSIPYRLVNDQAYGIQFTRVTENPPDPEFQSPLIGVTFPANGSAQVVQIVLPGTTHAGMDFEWVKAGDPKTTGKFTVTAPGAFPACPPKVRADITAACTANTADVRLANTSTQAVTFRLDGVAYGVSANGSQSLRGVPTPSGKLKVDVYLAWAEIDVPVTRFTWSQPSGCSSGTSGKSGTAATSGAPASGAPASGAPASGADTGAGSTQTSAAGSGSGSGSTDSTGSGTGLAQGLRGGSGSSVAAWAGIGIALIALGAGVVIFISRRRRPASSIY